MLRVLLVSSIVVLGVRGGAVLHAVPEPVDLYPQYSFGYSVQDTITGDIKGQTETRDGNLVKGQYSLVEPDGSIRTVTYIADHNGFNAVVDRQAAAAPVQIVKAQSFAVPAHAHYPVAPAIAALPPLGSHRPVIGIQQQPIAIQQQPIAIARPPRPIQVIPQRPIQVIQQRPVVHPVVHPIQQQPQRPVVIQPPTLPQPVVPEFDEEGAIEIPSSDFVEQQPSQPEPAPPQQPPPPPQFPPPAPVQLPQFPQPTPVQLPQFPPPSPVQLPQLPPQQPPQLPPQQPAQVPQAQPPQQPAQQPSVPQFEDEEGAIEISADSRTAESRVGPAGPARDGRSSFTYNSSRGNQFNFRIAV